MIHADAFASLTLARPCGFFCKQFNHHEQSKQTETTRRLAAWAAILAVPTAIAGIYGMNFEYMPELKWKYGYLLIIGGMATICGTLYYQFRKAKWL